MGKAYLHGGRTATAVNSNTLGGHEPEWYERPQRNLLLNGDFRVNQQKQSEYAGPGYNVDCWSTLESNSPVVVGSDYIQVTSGENWTALRQLLEHGRNLIGKTVTLSCLACAEGGAVGVQAAMRGPGTFSAIDGSLKLQTVTDYTVISSTFVVPEMPDGANFEVTVRGSTAGQIFKVKKVKLECGNHFTGWDEADPGDELVKCRRQYVRWGPYEKAGLALGYSATNATGYILLPQMRARPVVRYSNLSLSTDSHVVTGVTLATSSPSLIELAITSNVTSGVTYDIRVSAGGYLELDARL